MSTCLAGRGFKDPSLSLLNCHENENIFIKQQEEPITSKPQDNNASKKYRHKFLVFLIALVNVAAIITTNQTFLVSHDTIDTWELLQEVPE